MRLAHHHPEGLDALRTPTEADPWRVLVSGCMLGWGCGVDGSDYGMGGTLAEFFGHPCVQSLPFCPEDTALGTPRGMPDIHGGDGLDVLDSKAKVLDEQGHDLTAGMIAGAEAMLAFAREQRVELAVLTDMSAACGTQVISDGGRLVEPRRYRRGVGVAAALLVRAGIGVVSQRDYRTLEGLWRRLDVDGVATGDAIDHHESEWYREYFGDRVVLRAVTDTDLGVFFEQQRDPEAIAMAAFTAKDPDDRPAFDTHWRKIRGHGNVTLRTILLGGRVAGHVCCHSWFGRPEVGYWIGRRYWGRGVATRALAAFLAEVPARPLHARVAKDNAGSIRVLGKCGFVVTGKQRGFANARGERVEELLLSLG